MVLSLDVREQTGIYLSTGVDDFLSRQKWEEQLGQKGIVLWFTGLSGAGKTTIAWALQRKLYEKQLLCQILDGDQLRTGLTAGLGFSVEDRMENVRRIAEAAKLFCNCGIITIVSLISPTQQIRQLAKAIVGEDSFAEVYVNASVKTCESRDPKGLYQKARMGVIKEFTGVSARYEIPENPDLTIQSDTYSVDFCVNQLVAYIQRLQHQA